MTIHYRDARPEDGPALAAMAAQSFIATFGHLYTPETLAAYLDKAFGPAGLPAQIGDPDYPLRLVLEGERIVAYAKLGPSDVAEAPDAIMLRQFYILEPWQGIGIAPVLMDWVLATARARGASRLILSVYIDNHRARRCYVR